MGRQQLCLGKFDAAGRYLTVRCLPPHQHTCETEHDADSSLPQHISASSKTIWEPCSFCETEYDADSSLPQHISASSRSIWEACNSKVALLMNTDGPGNELAGLALKASRGSKDEGFWVLHHAL